MLVSHLLMIDEEMLSWQMVNCMASKDSWISVDVSVSRNCCPQMVMLHI